LRPINHLVTLCDQEVLKSVHMSNMPQIEGV
jgi:hypothetical protein